MRLFDCRPVIPLYCDDDDYRLNYNAYFWLSGHLAFTLVLVGRILIYRYCRQEQNDDDQDNLAMNNI